MIETLTVKQELYPEHIEKINEIKRILVESNARIWEKVGDSLVEFDKNNKLRRELVEDFLRESGAENDAIYYPAFHYFIGSSPEREKQEGHPFDTPNEDVFNAIKKAVQYF